jgi:hypothetical protein
LLCTPRSGRMCVNVNNVDDTKVIVIGTFDTLCVVLCGGQERPSGREHLTPSTRPHTPEDTHILEKNENLYG